MKKLPKVRRSTMKRIIFTPTPKWQQALGLFLAGAFLGIAFLMGLVMSVWEWAWLRGGRE